jgi:transposase-like protein
MIVKIAKKQLETAIIERYRRRESSVEEALIQMYLRFQFAESKTLRKPCGAHESVLVSKHM